MGNILISENPLYVITYFLEVMSIMGIPVQIRPRMIQHISLVK